MQPNLALYLLAALFLLAAVLANPVQRVVDPELENSLDRLLTAMQR